ncbi:MAG: extracellular solute-binding protein [Eubacterium sp.]|nr:extracellular solute-binding protein [Candidatus Colimonas fimequi]
MKTSVKKIVAIIAAMAMTLCLFAGCGSSDSASSDGPVTIKFGIHVANPAEQEPVTNQIVTDFNAANDGQYTVEFEAADTETHSKNMKLEAEDGTLPDIFWIDASEAPEYAEAGIIADLSGYLADNADIDEALNGMENAFNNGDMQYGLPYQCNVQGFYYNKALFDKAGVDYPTNATTQDEFMEMVNKLNAAGITPISIGSKNSAFAMWPFNEYLTRYGWDNLEGTYNTPEMVKCFEKIAALTEAKAFNDTVATSEYFDAKQAFLDGNAAMFGSGQWDCGACDEALGENVAFWWGPQFTDTDAPQEMAMKVPSAPIVVNAASMEDPAKAAAITAFLNYYYGPEAAATSFAGSIFPATNYADVAATETQYAMNSMIEALGDGWQSPTAAPDQTLSPAVQEALYDAIFGVIQGNYSPADALDKMDAAAAN